VVAVAITSALALAAPASSHDGATSYDGLIVWNVTDRATA
jgi:hypothetical protein